MKPETTAITSLLEHSEPDASLYRRLLRDARRSGRCPVLLHPATLDRCGEEFMTDTQPIDIDDADPARVLSGWWPGPCPDGCTCLDPFTGELPALARLGGRDLSRHRSTIDTATDVVREADGIASMAVVAAARPADVPLALLWSGMVNYRDRDLSRAGAVLRSWEERFGAVLVHMGPAALLLSVARPPRTVEESELVAAEHFAFCPDQIDPQDGRGPLSPRTYAETIRGHFLWRFWWD